MNDKTHRLGVSQNPHYWLGYLSMMLALAHKEAKKGPVRDTIRDTLREFMASPQADPDLRRKIVERMR